MIYNLIKKGYGTYDDILNLDTHIFLDMCEYEDFLSTYQETYMAESESRRNK